VLRQETWNSLRTVALSKINDVTITQDVKHFKRFVYPTQLKYAIYNFNILIIIKHGRRTAVGEVRTLTGYTECHLRFAYLLSGGIIKGV